MADQATSKIDAAAEKAYAEAAAQTAPGKKAAATPETTAKSEVAAKVAEAAPAPKPAIAKAPDVSKTVTAEAPVKKTPVKKAPAKKAAEKKILAKNTTAKKTAAKPAAKTGKPAPVKAPSTKTFTPKETIMTKAKETAADYTAQVKEGLADLQTRAKTVYDKSTVLASEMGEFSKQNAEAVVESSKILATGVQSMAKSYVEEGKAAISTLAADAKEIAAVKSPTDFVHLQSQIASRNFDAAVANVSKTTEAWVKLANEAFAPISTRVSVAMDKVRKAA